jgi:hypothetical protein
MLPQEKITVHVKLGLVGPGYIGSRITRRLIAAGFPMRPTIAIARDDRRTKAASLRTSAPNLRSILERRGCKLGSGRTNIDTFYLIEETPKMTLRTLVGVRSAEQASGIAGAADIQLTADDMLDIHQALTRQAA